VDERSGGRAGRRLRIGLGVTLGVVLLAAGGLWAVVEHSADQLDQQVTRVPGVFEPVRHRPLRPEGEAAQALNILVMGTDLRSDEPTTGRARDTTDRAGSSGADDVGGWVPGSQRSDTMMVLHLAADRRSAAVVSLPRDAWVPVPGHGSAKINAAFSWGGPSLAVQTVEDLTGVRLDHVAWIDWDGFRELTDVLGGVDVWVPHTVHDSARDVTWTRGMHHLDGEEALTYVRQRYGLDDGDLDRVKRQQYYLRALMDNFRHSFRATSPLTGHALLDAVTRHLSVDEGLDQDRLRDLLGDLTDLRSNDVDFLTAPVAGYGTEGEQSVVRLDAALGEQLWAAVLADDVPAWVSEHPDLVTASLVQ